MAGANNITSQPISGAVGDKELMPFGMGILSMIDKFIVREHVECGEALNNYDVKQKYEVKNDQGQLLFYAFEGSDCWTDNCFCGHHSYHILLFDTQMNPVMKFYRPRNLLVGCIIPACLLHMSVSTRADEDIGRVHDVQHWFMPTFNVESRDGVQPYRIRGPMFVRSHANSTFQISDAQGFPVGLIRKPKPSSSDPDLLTNKHAFNITFPTDMDVSTKATLLAAGFLIKAKYYDRDE